MLHRLGSLNQCLNIRQLALSQGPQLIGGAAVLGSAEELPDLIERETGLLRGPHRA